MKESEQERRRKLSEHYKKRWQNPEYRKQTYNQPIQSK